jgi:hypothetical protein
MFQKKMENSDEIRFIVEDETFVSSKARLVAASDYFKALLLGNFQAVQWIRNRWDPELCGSRCGRIQEGKNDRLK